MATQGTLETYIFVFCGKKDANSVSIITTTKVDIKELLKSIINPDVEINYIRSNH